MNLIKLVICIFQYHEQKIQFQVVAPNSCQRPLDIPLESSGHSWTVQVSPCNCSACLPSSSSHGLRPSVPRRGNVLESPSGKAMENPWKTHGNHIQHHQRIEHISNIEQEYYMCIVDPTFAPKNLPLGATCLLVQK